MAKEKKTSLGSVEVREVEVEYGETGVGVSNRTDVEYQLGAEINGAWTPFVTVAAGRAEMYAARAEAEADGDDKAAAPTP